MHNARTQSRSFIAAWLGWAFDGLDGYLYALVAVPFVTELMAAGTPKSEVASKAALIQAVFLVGWALGGGVFGRIGDRLGRARTLTLTIVTYAVFTGLSFFAHEWWHLMIFRFLAALGIGGEWAAGSALVAETLHKKYKHWASAGLQSGYVTGMILAALTVGAMGTLDPRYVFLVGVIPAFLTIWIRKAVPETEEWQAERQGRTMPPISELFRGDVLKTTLITLGITCISLTSIWALLFFAPQVIQGLEEVKSLPKPRIAETVRNVIIVISLWNIAGNFFASFLAKTLGYRKAFVILFALSFVTYFVGFGQTRSLQMTEVWLSATMFFGSGVFALYPLYIPPLFPVLIRTTGSGFCYNVGRLVAALGTLYGGTIAANNGGPLKAMWFAGFLYIPAAIIACFALEHKDAIDNSEDGGEMDGIGARSRGPGPGGREAGAEAGR